MLTQCPQCQTVFRVAPAQLRAAAGRVRCGQCDNVFAALDNTEEDEQVARVHTSTDVDLEVTAIGDDGELESDPLEDTAEHELLDLEVESARSVEITMEGERIAIDGEDLPVEMALDEELQPAQDGEDTGTPQDSPEAPPDQPPPQPPPVEEFVLPSGAHVTFGESQSEALPAALQPQPRQRRFLQWGIGSTVLALALAAQLVHFNREALAHHALIGKPLSQLYAYFGVELAPPWDLLAYELRQWGASADPQSGGTLHVRASLFNNADHPQPYPLLRLTLQDRFGGQVSARDITPEQYLHNTPDQMLGTGQRVDAQIAIVDPGKDAVGFEIDVCLQQRNAGVVCASEKRAQRTP